MASSNPGIHRIAIGGTVVTALNDGQFEAAAAWVTGIDAADLERQLGLGFRPFPPRITLNAFLIETKDRTILVDGGAGNKFLPTLGAVGRRLASLDVAPAAIDTILLTHAHVDHVGGLTDDAGVAVYPRAELVVGRTEYAFWSDDTIMAAAPDGAKGGFVAARTAFAAYASRTRLVDDGEEVAPGIRVKALPGHTPGPNGYRLDDGGASLLIWADIVHLPGVQFARPEVGMGFDSDGARAIETRRAIFAEAAASGLMVAGMHLDFPTFCHVRAQGDQVEAVPLVWAPDA